MIAMQAIRNRMKYMDGGEECVCVHTLSIYDAVERPSRHPRHKAWQKGGLTILFANLIRLHVRLSSISGLSRFCNSGLLPTLQARWVIQFLHLLIPARNPDLAIRCNGQP